MSVGGTKYHRGKVQTLKRHKMLTYHREDNHRSAALLILSQPVDASLALILDSQHRTIKVPATMLSHQLRRRLIHRHH